MTVMTPSSFKKRQSVDHTRRAAVVFAVLFAIGAPLAQSLFPFGFSASEFASDGDDTLRAATYAFSIWGVIYTALAAYAIYQVWPGTSDTALLQAVGWPSVIAIAGCGAWILASAFDQKVATVSIIIVSAATIARAVANHAYLAANAREHFFAVWPLGLLAGWLTIASAINALTVLTAFGLIREDTAPVAGVVGVAIVTLLAVVVLHRAHLISYGIPIAWGLAAVYVAERDHRPMVAIGAGGASLLIAAVTLFVGLRSRRNESEEGASHVRYARK